MTKQCRSLLPPTAAGTLLCPGKGRQHRVGPPYINSPVTVNPRTGRPAQNGANWQERGQRGSQTQSKRSWCISVSWTGVRLILFSDSAENKACNRHPEAPGDAGSTGSETLSLCFKGLFHRSKIFCVISVLQQSHVPELLLFPSSKWIKTSSHTDSAAAKFCRVV